MVKTVTHSLNHGDDCGPLSLSWGRLWPTLSIMVKTVVPLFTMVMNVAPPFNHSENCILTMVMTVFHSLYHGDDCGPTLYRGDDWLLLSTKVMNVFPTMVMTVFLSLPW